ncbi:MAG: hypothetical protein JWQ97_1835, partial [Phenylobacterium sp.]|nr:hypothetical protein [Phenylobacterium sp.]
MTHAFSGFAAVRAADISRVRRK